MARINNLTKYPYDYNITENDFVIGTDGDNKKTKNFPVVALAEYVRSSNNLSYDRIISIGEVTSEDNNITINVADLGNVVYINEKFYTKNTPDVFTFTPVTEGVKIILLYALPDEQVFYMIEGVESNEAVEPDLPSGALFVQRIIVTVNGVEIIPNTVIISDNKVQITEETPFANIGQSQKEFNKNISDKLISLTDSTEVTKTELDVLISENKLEPNRLYKITGIESWCFSQHLIKAIYLKAITNNTLESEGVGEFYTPKYNISDSNLGIWKGELLANGMIDSLSYNIGDKVIWGNLFWENISGNIGTNEKEYDDEESDEWFFVKSQNLISETDWQLITPNDDESLYNIQFDSIKYDLENDYINYRADNLGNVYEISYSTLLNRFPNSDVIGNAPEFIYNINSIALFQWGRGNTSNNIINESIVLNCNYNVILFQKNIIENSRIYDNNFFNINFIGNTFKNSQVIANYLKTYGGILYNNLDNSSINLNKYYFEISNNTLNNYSNILNNNDNNIIVNGSYSSITSNNLDNNSFISSNTFVEEGKGVSGYVKGINGNEIINNSSINNNTIKNGSRIFDHNLSYFSTINGNTLDTDSNIYNNQLAQNGKIDNNILTGHGRIYGNEIINNSSINNNTIKNGSRIFDHNLSYFSTINGNTLDTESNIYNNQVVQNGKIDNNILTGHGRIYGNQLDRLSEITNCKLRISPATSYATTMKNNRLFAGKIQNVDFGNIVNPVGSDPNNPAFGGNALSECIIENESIIKDLTFPNHGGVGLQFIKMNGASEFKNITVNDSIRSVEFINTVFDETSDYSKIIQGAAYGGVWFTKYYLDNVLLQDRFDNKQDILTNPVTGTGTTDYLPKFTASGIIENSQIFDNGTNVGIGTINPINKFTILGADDTLPTLGTSSGKLGIFNRVSGNPTYGMLYGVLGTGSSYIQSQRVDGAATAYDLLIQPSGGNVSIGGITTPSEKLDVNGYTKSTGFKTPTGTATEALTANGEKFDLTTKADLVNGKVPSSQLPSYVDDVLEFANLASFPATGESGKIYIAIDTNITYRWSGTGYAEISASLALGETSNTAYRGDRGKIAYDHSQVTHDKTLVGLGNVDNTSDLNKPISTATQNALNTKANIDDIPSKTTFTYDILVSNWTLVSGKYEAVISNAGILANSFVDVIPSNDHVDIVRDAQIYPSILISEGSVKVYSKFLPSGTISVTVNIN